MYGKPFFNPSLIDAEVFNQVPTHFVLRPLEIGDFEKGYLLVLENLTTVGDVNKDSFVKRMRFMYEKNLVGNNDNEPCNDEYFPIVIEDTRVNKIVGVGTVFIERKFIHNLGSVAHFEDVAVLKPYRGLHLGVVIMRALKSIGKNMGCYKAILDAADHNVPYYTKVIAFQKKENQMCFYYTKPKL